MSPEELASRLVIDFPDFGLQARVEHDHAVVEVAPERIAALLEALKSHADHDFAMLMDLTAVDWFEKRAVRFDLVYHLYSVNHNHRLRVKAAIAENQHAPTVCRLWPIADWFEREVWDLYGIKFDGHPNLKRLLTYDEFKGHALRKDYPYNKTQPLIEESWPARSIQIHMKEAGKIHRP